SAPRPARRAMKQPVCRRTLSPPRPARRRSWPRVAVGAVACLALGALAYAVLVPRQEGPFINPASPPVPAPQGMVWVPGGRFWMGDELFADARPVHLVYVDGFWMDQTEVTNAQFAEFVRQTGYVTVAEQQPDPAEFPDVPPQELAPFSLV